MKSRGQQQAGQNPRQQQLADRLLGEQPVDDERGARRDEDAERAAGGDHAGREPVAVVVAPHLRQADLAHGHRRGDARSRHRGKSGAGEDGGVREPAAHMADPGIGGGIEIARHARHRAEIAHQHEQRDDGEVVDRGVLIGIAAERGERGLRPVEDRKADDADQQHGDADRHAQRHQQQQHPDADQSDGVIARHRAGPSAS